MLNPIDTTKKPSGGGLFGKILGPLGTVVGGAAGAIAGGPAGAMAGAKLGGTIGGVAGTAAQIIDPAKAGSQRGVALSTVAEKDPEVNFQQLRDAQTQMQQETNFTPEEKEQLHGVLEQGKLYYKNMFSPPKLKTGL